MASPLPPDPYLALGVAKDATTASIKKRYHKLALQFHPDKVQDAAQKQAACDEFHKVQTAYEIIGDEDKRKRYDAQCKLAQLRKEAMESRTARSSGGEGRNGGARVPAEATRTGGRYERTSERTERVSPLYEERKPSFAQPEYFEPAPRHASKKEFDYDYEGTSRRTSTRSERERTKTSRQTKEQEKTSRRERSKKTEREVHRDRDRKQSYVEVDEFGSDSDSEYEKLPMRRRRAEEADRKAREYRQAESQRRAAKDDYFVDEYDQKLRFQEDEVRAYTARAARNRAGYESQPRRSSPLRQTSARETADEIRAQRPIPFRTGSGRPRLSPEDEVPRRSSVDERSRRRAGVEIVEPPSARRPTTLKQSVSSPLEMRPELDRQRSQSVQIEKENGGFRAPPIRRAETMPAVHEVRPSAKRSSGPRHTEQDDAYVIHEFFGEQKMSSSPKRHDYFQPEEYSNEREYSPTDTHRSEYKTEVRKPPQQRRARSPSPEFERERQRSIPSKHTAPPQPPRPTPVPRASSRTTYTINPDTGAEPFVRPSYVSRESSNPSHKLYGEVENSTRSSRSRRAYSPVPEPYREARSPQVNYRMNSGSRRGSHMPEAPSYSRSNSYQTVNVR